VSTHASIGTGNVNETELGLQFRNMLGVPQALVPSRKEASSESRKWWNALDSSHVRNRSRSSSMQMQRGHKTRGKHYKGVNLFGIKQCTQSHVLCIVLDLEKRIRS
jgi:hypothetical protein